MSAAHTPGPWRIQQPDADSPSIWIDAEGNSGIAKIEVCDYDDDLGERHTDEDQANARLITAAPDLLAAVILLLEPLEQASAAMVAQGKVLNEAGEAVFDFARAAIAKALGQ